MKHLKKINHLGRTSKHRKAMLSNMSCSLIISERKRIHTTLSKAKALRKYIEPIFTKSKIDNTHSRRIIFSYLKNKLVVNELFKVISPMIINRNGGYTRIIRTGSRVGDSAVTALIEIVDFNKCL
jgi:large subunit ribosomal protein L17